MIPKMTAHLKMTCQTTQHLTQRWTRGAMMVRPLATVSIYNATHATHYIALVLSYWPLAAASIFRMCTAFHCSYRLLAIVSICRMCTAFHCATTLLLSY